VTLRRRRTIGGEGCASRRPLNGISLPFSGAGPLIAFVTEPRAARQGSHPAPLNQNRQITLLTSIAAVSPAASRKVILRTVTKRSPVGITSIRRPARPPQPRSILPRALSLIMRESSNGYGHASASSGVPADRGATPATHPPLEKAGEGSRLTRPSEKNRMATRAGSHGETPSTQQKAL